jgi:hemoglobin-like flavoprotein
MGGLEPQQSRRSIADRLVVMTPSMLSTPGIHADLDDATRKAVDIRARHTLIVQQTWDVLERNLSEETTRLFYERLFETNSQIIPLFENVNMVTQAHSLYQVLQVTVRFLANTDVVTPFLDEIGARHALYYGVGPAHYKVLSTVLTETIVAYFVSLPETSPERRMWCSEAADAWSWALTEITTIMIVAADREIKKVAELSSIK